MHRQYRLIVTRNSCSGYRQNRARTSFNYQGARRIPRKKIRGPSPSDNRILARGPVALRDNSEDEGLKGKLQKSELGLAVFSSRSNLVHFWRIRLPLRKPRMLLGGREEVDVERPSLRLGTRLAYMEEVRCTIWVAVCRILRQEDLRGRVSSGRVEFRGTRN